MMEQRMQLLAELRKCDFAPDIDQPRPSHQEELKSRLQESRKRYREAVKNASKNREKFLEERAEATALHTGKAKEKVLKQILASEESAKDFEYLSILRGKTKSGGLSSIKVPTGETDANDKPIYTEIFDQNQITRHLIDRNTKHFNQAQGTPFTEGLLFEMFGWDGTGPAADAVLDGTLDIDSLDTTDAVKSVLRRLRKREDWSPIKTEITTEEFIAGFRKWNERTSTSPSGRNLSMYKALVAFESREQPDDPDEAAPPTDGERIFDVLTGIKRLFAVMQYSKSIFFLRTPWRILKSISKIRAVEVPYVKLFSL